MAWSNWRGALVVLFGWAGLAWAQAPVPAPPGKTPERIMVVHENGKSTRCRILQTWQLADGKKAHQLQAVDTGEMITIIDDVPAGGASAQARGKGTPKRIFHWGATNTTPPPGVPIPPQLMIDSGVVLHKEINAPPPGAIVLQNVGTSAPKTPVPAVPLPVVTAAPRIGGLALDAPAATKPASSTTFTKLPVGPVTPAPTPPASIVPPVVVLTSGSPEAPAKTQQKPSPIVKTNESAPKALTVPAAPALPVVALAKEIPPKAPTLPAAPPALPIIVQAKDTPAAAPTLPAAPVLPVIAQASATAPEVISVPSGKAKRSDGPASPVIVEGKAPEPITTAPVVKIIEAGPTAPVPDATTTLRGWKNPVPPAEPKREWKTATAPAAAAPQREWKTPTAPVSSTTAAAPPPAPAAMTPRADTSDGGAERIVNLTEGKQKTRCRVLYSWQLPDGRAAQQLQALETSELITVYDDHASGALSIFTKLKAQPKRIYHWGLTNPTPPPDVPIPPSALAKAGPVVLKHETATAATATRPTAAAQANAKAPVPAAPSTTKDTIESPFAQFGASKTTTPDAKLLPFSTAADRNLVPPEAPVAKVKTEAPLSLPAPPTLPAPPPVTPVSATAPRGPETPVTPATALVTPPAPVGPTAPLPVPAPVAPPAPVTMLATPPAPLAPAAPPLPAPITPVAQAAAPLPLPVAPTVPAMPAPIAPMAQGELPLKMPGAPSIPAAPAPVASTTQAPAPAPAAPPVPVVVPLPMPPAAVAATAPAPEKAAEPKRAAQGLRSLWSKTDKESTKATPSAPAAPKTLEVVRLPDAPPAPVVPAPAKKADILLNPDKFNPTSADLRARTMPTPPTSAKDTPVPEPVGPSAQAVKEWPLGAQSVLAARSGLPAQVAYVPVPMVAVPQPVRPPLPPEPSIPSAPQANAYVNAFTPPPQSQPAMPGGGMPPAPYGMPAPMAYQGYGMNPYYAAQQRMMYPYAQQAMPAAYGYPYPQQAMMPAMYPYAMNQAMQAGYPMNLPRNYPGPQAPYPYANPAAPTAVTQTSYAPPATSNPVGDPQQSMPAVSQIEQLAKVLRESPYPSQREWAAHAMTAMDTRSHALVLPLLLQAATRDPAPTVRAGCVHCLPRLCVTPEAYTATLQTLRGDADPRVRQEVEQVLARPGQARAVSGSN